MTRSGETATPDVLTITIRYGDGTREVHLPSTCTVNTVGRRSGHGPNEDAVLRDALADPLDASPLAEFLRGARAPLVVVNDATRSTPTATILRTVMPAVAATPDWRVIVATGLHRPPSEPELNVVLGPLLDTVRPRLLIHNGWNAEQMVSFHTPDGVVELNRAVAEADRLLVIGSVEPHFFAGFTGGRKSILPGIAGYRTVERSHAGAVRESAAPLRVLGNPVREFIHKATGVYPSGHIWSIQVVLDRDDRVVAAFAGEIDKTFAAATGVARKYYVANLQQLYDIVVAVVYPPLDVSLYQAQKGWELSQCGVRDGGVLILTSPCHEGVGSPFYAQLRESFPDRDEWASLSGRPYRMGIHKLIRIARATRRIRIMAVTGMARDEVEAYGYEAYESVDRAVHAAVAHVGRSAYALVVEDAALTALAVETAGN